MNETILEYKRFLRSLSDRELAVIHQFIQLQEKLDSDKTIDIREINRYQLGKDD